MMKHPNVALEELRQSYKPSEVRVLFVGESPPVNGTFFYLENSHLWRYTRQAFERVYGDEYRRSSNFCQFFMSKGCFLEDLSICPVNHLPEKSRHRTCEASITSLAERMSSLSPAAVICMKLSIVRQVESAMAKAGLQSVPLYKLPFPTFGHQPEYIEGLAELIKKLRGNGVIV